MLDSPDVDKPSSEYDLDRIHAFYDNGGKSHSPTDLFLVVSKRLCNLHTHTHLLSAPWRNACPTLDPLTPPVPPSSTHDPETNSRKGRQRYGRGNLPTQLILVLDLLQAPRCVSVQPSCDGSYDTLPDLQMLPESALEVAFTATHNPS